MILAEVDGLRKVYRSRRGDVVAVDGVSFGLAPGEVVGLLGPNGAGKTTTIKSMCTLVRPSAGRIVIDGVDALAHPRAAVRKISGVLEGNRNVYWRLTPEENLAFFAGLQGITRAAVRTQIADLLERFGLSEKARTPARMLSKGMQQKLAIACALIRRTPLLVLDEPTLGLDVEASYELRALIKDLVRTEERTVLLSSHDMAVVQDVCERVIIINHGRVVTDDRVANLLELFRARSYRFELAAPASDGMRAALAERFESVTFDDSGVAGIELNLTDGAGLYDVVDILRAGGAVIDAVDRRQPDLEQVFLRIVREGRT